MLENSGKIITVEIYFMKAIAYEHALIIKLTLEIEQKYILSWSRKNNIVGRAIVLHVADCIQILASHMV